MTKWVSVSDRPPFDRQEVLSYCIGGGMATCIFYVDQDNKGYFMLIPSRISPKEENLFAHLMNVTHWQPLPEPPEGE